MITPVILPQLGDTMNEGLLLKWYKQEGESVKKGEPLFEVLTDKANMEVEATASGFLRAVRRRENETVPTGEIIAFVSTTYDEPLGGFAPASVTPTAEGQLPPAPAVPTTGESKEGGTRVKRSISPRARRLAEEKGIDLAQVAASSRSGRVVEADVIKVMEGLERARAVQAPPPATVAEKARPPEKAVELAAAEQVMPLVGVRKIIAERMAASSQQVARVTLTTEADATPLVELRAAVNEQRQDGKFSYTDFLVLLVAKALRKHPHLNSTLREDGIHRHASVHMGIAVDTERGLLVPVLRDADKKGLAEISQLLRELSEGARTGKISPDRLGGSTFTITNLGQFEIDAFTPIVNLPETAILGVGRIAQKPAAFRGQIALRHMVALSLSFDHRVVDGGPAARFLQEVKRFVETPGLVLL